MHLWAQLYWTSAYGENIKFPVYQASLTTISPLLSFIHFSWSLECHTFTFFSLLQKYWILVMSVEPPLAPSCDVPLYFLSDCFYRLWLFLTRATPASLMPVDWKVTKWSWATAINCLGFSCKLWTTQNHWTSPCCWRHFTLCQT